MYLGRSQTGWAGILALVLIFIVFAGAGIFAVSKISDTSSNSPKNDVASNGSINKYSRIGFSISPSSYDQAGLSNFFERSKEVGGVVTWAGDWDELGKSGKGPSMLMNNAKKYQYNPIASVTAFKDSGNNKVEPIRELSNEQVELYVQQAQNFVEKYKPEYFGVGIEVNRIYESSESDYAAFVDLFNKVSDEVHRVSANTKVFTSFQLERIRGLKGGLFGGTNDTNQNNLEIINDFAKADIISFTSYPNLIYKLPSEIPENYYVEMSGFTTKPIGISELGWPAADVAEGWPNSPETQLEFVKRFKELTNNTTLEFKVWSFMYDQQVSQPFSNLGLIDINNSPRPAWEEFIK